MEKTLSSYRNETDGLFIDTFRAVRAAIAWGWEKLASSSVTIEEAPEGSPSAAPTRVTMGGTRTMRELGIPGPLAGEMELMLEMMGKVKGDRILGYTFVTPGGMSYKLRTERNAEERLDRAA